MAQKDTVTTGTGRNLKHPLIPPLVCVILAVGAAVGAFFASGILEVILIILAILLSAYTVMLYVAALLNAITTTSSWRREHAKRDRPENIERAVLAMVPDAPGEIRVGAIGHQLFGGQPTRAQVHSLKLAVRSLGAQGLVTINYKAHPMWVSRDGTRGSGPYGPNALSRAAPGS